MTDDSDPNALNTAGSAIAAFQLAQYAFAALVKNGIIPKAEAERILRQAVEANKSGGPGNQAAAQMLAIVLENVSAFRPTTRR